MTIESTTIALTINPTLVVSLAINPTTTTVGQSTTLTASVTGGTGPYIYTWTNLPSPCTGTSNTITCSPNAAGIYNVSVQVKDASGSMISATGTLTVDPSTLSVSMIISPTTISLGQNVTFTATANGGVGPYNYAWSGLPGGCIGGNINKLTCTPIKTGIFTISVTVTDSSTLNAISTGSLRVKKR